MAAASSVSAVRDRLDYLLLNEGAPAGCTGDLRDRVMQLRGKLETMTTILEDEDETGNTGSAVGLWKLHITELAYAIEDSIESYARKEAESRHRTSLFRCFLDCSAAKRLREDLHILEFKLMEELRPDSEDIYWSLTRRDAASGSGTTTHDRLIRETVHKELPGHIIGMEDDVRSVMDLMLNGSSRRSVIAICGMGGSGKTTLAQRLYNHPLVAEHFHCRAWAAVSMDFEARHILEAILFSLSSTWVSKEEIIELETMDLMEQLYKAQKGRRYLVVLDDVWSIEAWDTIKIAFPSDNNGSRVVVTSRIEMPFADYTYRMKLLDEDQSWMLFKSRLRGQGEQLNPEIESIGRQIVRQCEGLPLAINAVSSTFSGRNLTYWKRILHELGGQRLNFAEIGGDGSLGILALSYDRLPLTLKPCLLYLGNFPTDEGIMVEKLHLLWMAEGLIPTRNLNYKEGLKIAEDHLNDLVSRSLVIVAEAEKMTEIRIKSCVLHDLIRDLCISKGKQENFFEVVEFGREIKSSLAPRISIYLNKFEDGNALSSNFHEVKHIRTILFFDTKDSSTKRCKPIWPRDLTDLGEFQSIRVLHFDGVDFQIKTLPTGIEKLLYLRYLSFRGCYLQVLPSSFGNFLLLETLDLHVQVHCRLTIPNVLRKILSLRHLYFPVAYMTDTEGKLKLDTLKKLEVLENFHAGICDAADLKQLESLQILTGVVDGNNEDLENVISFLNEVKGSCQSSLVVKNFDSYSKKRLSIVAKLLKCDALHALDMEGHLSEFPCHERIGPNLTEITLSGSELDEDPMPLLGKFPNLRILALCDDAYLGEKIMCLEGSFLELVSLNLVKLQSLEKWEMEMGAMPRLTVLAITQCSKLRMLPDYLMDIPTLQRLKIESMPNHFQEEVRRIVEEQLSYGNEQISVSFYDC